MIYSQPSQVSNNIESKTSSNLLKETQKDITDRSETESRQYNILDNILSSWKKIKYSTKEFMQSNSELYKNVITNIENLEDPEKDIKEYDITNQEEVSISISNHKKLADPKVNKNEINIFEDETERALLYKSFEEIQNEYSYKKFNRFSVESKKYVLYNF